MAETQKSRRNKKNHGSLKPRVFPSSHCQGLCIREARQAGKVLPIGREKMKKENWRRKRERPWGDP